MKDVITGFLGPLLTKEALKKLDEFIKLDLEEEEIYKSILNFSDLIIMSMYLLALDMNENDLAYKIKKASKRIQENRIEKFTKACDKGKGEEFLMKLGKFDKVNLATSMGLYLLSNEEYKVLSSNEKKYYKTLEAAIFKEDSKN